MCWFEKTTKEERVVLSGVLLHITEFFCSSSDINIIRTLYCFNIGDQSLLVYMYTVHHSSTAWVSSATW